jgi:hypothetical protein
MKRTMLSLALLCGATALQAAPATGGLEYDYLEVGLINVSAGPVDGDGLRLGGSFALNETAYLVGAWTDASLDPGNTDFSTLSVGLGLRTALDPSLHLIGELSFEDVEVGAGSDDGFALKGGLRKQVTDALELDLYVKQVELTNNDTLLGLGAVWKMTQTVRAVLGLESGDADRLMLGLRVAF